MISFSDRSTLPFAPGGLAPAAQAAWVLVRELHGQARLSSLEGQAILQGLSLAAAPPPAPAEPVPDAAGEEHGAVADAIRIAGSQARLAELAGISQQHLSRLLRRQQDVSADAALKIEAATSGRVSRSRLRPDYWPAPAPSTAAENREDRP